MKNLLCKTTLLSTVCFMLISSNALYAGDEHYKLPLKANKSLNISILPGKKVNIKIKDGYVIVDFGRGNTQRLLNVKESLEQIPYLSIEFADFNFDKMLDIAIPLGIAYGGINTFYDLFFFDNKIGNFKNMLSDVSNITLDKKNKELWTMMKSGNYWSSNVYRFINGKPYIHSYATILGEIQRIEFKEPNGRIVKTVIAEYPQNEHMITSNTDYPHYDDTIKSAVKIVKKERAYLYNEPYDEASKTGMYVIKGDKVVLLDVIPADCSFVFIQYTGKKDIKKWIKSEDIDLNRKIKPSGKQQRTD